MATIAMLNRLPQLDDDGDVGVEKEHLVPRDGAPDLKFLGTLVGSAAPEFHGQDRWREYRVYRTTGGKYVFSKIGRSVNVDEVDKFEASIYDPADPHKMYRSWERALTDTFRYDSLAKGLYAKLKIDTAERID